MFHFGRKEAYNYNIMKKVHQTYKCEEKKTEP